jgi:predicted nucleic acid-binding protein
VPEVVVDASVAAKWLLRDEDDLVAADTLLWAYDEDALVLYAPRQIDVEMAAALRKAILQERMTVDEAAEGLRLWLGSLKPRIRFAENDDLLEAALPRSIELGITLFDALYVVLAETLAVPLVVADSRLLRSPASQLLLIRALDTYQPGS